MFGEHGYKTVRAIPGQPGGAGAIVEPFPSGVVSVCVQGGALQFTPAMARELASVIVEAADHAEAR